MNQKNAFTLAEVLITLGIIGVVAAMTMPTLLNSTQGAQYRTGFKKAVSVLSQAVVLNMALDDYDTSQATSSGTQTNDSSLYNLFKRRMNVLKITSDFWNASGDGLNSNFGGANNYTFFFNDGMVLSFSKSYTRCTENAPCKMVIDLNGVKNPNTMVACRENTSGESCEVDNPTDIYPIKMYGQTVLPNSYAARVVMYEGR